MLKNYIEKELNSNYETETFLQYKKIADVIDYHAPDSYGYSPAELLNKINDFSWEKNGYPIKTTLFEVTKFVNDQFISNYIKIMVNQFAKNTVNKIIISMGKTDPAKKLQTMKELIKMTDGNINSNQDVTVYVDFNDLYKTTDQGKLNAERLNNILKYVEFEDEV